MAKYLKISVGVILFLLMASLASAHEAYVLPQSFFWSQLNSPISWQAFNALKDPHNLVVFIQITVAVLVIYSLNFLFRRSRLGKKFHGSLERLAVLGPIFIRGAIAAAFFASAWSWSFLGPELSLRALPYASLLRVLLFAASVMIAAGFMTELIAIIVLVIYTLGYFHFGAYIITYLNYLGEIIVLVLFGMRKWSVDGRLFGPLKRFKSSEKYGTAIVRVCYGIALIFAAITVKFLHPQLTITVVNSWHLTKFWWLFPSDPLLVTFGAGLAEMAIGFLILVGFQMRLTVFISLIYITMSLIYFRELVWPHLMLYGISLNLIFQPETFTLDKLLFS